MVASKTRIRVKGISVYTKALLGLDGLFFIVQMPRGYPVATMAIRATGAKNSGLMAASALVLQNTKIANRSEYWRSTQSRSISVELIDD